MNTKENWGFQSKSEIEEGILEYEEQKSLEKDKFTQTLDDIIGLHKDDDGSLNNKAFKEKLLEVSQGIKFAVLDRYLEINPKDCFNGLRYFGILPDKYQKIIHKYISQDESMVSAFNFENIFLVFEKITDEKLSKYILEFSKSKQMFSVIAQNKSKLPHITDEEILELLHYQKPFYGDVDYYDWASLACFIDMFPNIDNNKVIEGVFTQKAKQNIEVLVQNHRKFGFSEREIIDIFYEHGVSYKLLNYKSISYITDEYHQEIAERCIEDGNAWQVLDEANRLTGVDAKLLIDKILLISVPEKGSNKNGVDLLSAYICKLPESWLEYIPGEVMNFAIDDNIEFIAKDPEKFKKVISKSEIIEKLLVKKDFHSLCNARVHLNINTNTHPDFLDKVIAGGGADVFLSNSSFIENMITKENLGIVLKSWFLVKGKPDSDMFDFFNQQLLKLKISLQSLYDSLPDKEKQNIQEIKKISPEIESRIFSSFETFFAICLLDKGDIDLIVPNPNILTSFTKNPSMGIKLLIQYPKFSESPRENIDTILEIKRRIIEYHPDINPNSHEFRLLIQEQLKPYRRNLDMLTQMKEEGINIDQWLNYSEETLFELGGEEASYAELIKLPSERIQKTLQKYEGEIRSALSKYKKELFDKNVSLIDISDIQQKIIQMDQLAQEAIDAGNEGKAQGIQKGIEGLKKQLENPKQVSAWLKIMSDIDTVSKLFAKVTEINTQIATLDIELTTLTQNPSKESQKKMFENKKKIKELSTEFVSLLGTTSTRMDSLLFSIENSLSQTLGKDVSQEVISKLNRDLLEDQEHFNSDKATLQNILKLHESDDDVKGILLKIKVWSRNPDIDLYQGNYSDCCVRIDSEYHGSESPISDYITDLGIQIVSVYDEKTGKPFTTAWCFIGEDKQGNKAFVIDNIEATGPCMKYSHDIQVKLKAYIEKYAKESGLEIISQGPYNNDIEVTQNLEEKYTKLGGYNTRGGYYLEAEPETDDEESYHVNEDFERVEFERLEKIEEQRLINEYTRTQENIVRFEEALNQA